MDNYIGKRLDGRYEITELIGQGGMANVYKATDVLDNRIVAVKILKREFSESDEFLRRLLENQSIYQLTASENLTLIEGCRAIDPDFFVWLKNKQIKIPPRHIVYCVLIRMRKTKKEILSIFDISDGACRAMRSRVRASLGIEDEDMETFLQELH